MANSGKTVAIMDFFARFDVNSSIIIFYFLKMIASTRTLRILLMAAMMALICLGSEQ